MTRKKRTVKDHTNYGTAEYPKTPDAARFDNFKNGAYALSLAVFAAAASFNGFSDMWVLRVTPLEITIIVSQVLLFILLVVLVFRWIIATHYELDMWLTYLEHPLTKQQMYGAMCGISVTLGLLAAFPHRVLFVTGLFTTYSLLNHWTQWLCNDHLSHALAKTKKKSISEHERKVLEVMEHYWFKRPHLGRIATIMFFSFIAFSFALAGGFQQSPLKQILQVIAYFVLILTLIGSEILIGFWRHRRDEDIAALVNFAQER